MNDFNINFLKSDPIFDCTLRLTIDPLVPLSLCDEPGRSYVSTILPSRGKIYGLMENALGCHYHPNVRKYILNLLFGKNYKKVLEDTRNGYVSILQKHVKVDPQRKIPKHTRFFDYGTRHVFEEDSLIRNLAGVGSYDVSLIPIAQAIRQKRLKFDGSASAKWNPKNTSEIPNMQELLDIIDEDGEEVNIHFKLITDGRMPMFNSSPYKREFIQFEEDFSFDISTSKELADVLMEAINVPKYPLYLGNNEGFVDLELDYVDAK